MLKVAARDAARVIRKNPRIIPCRESTKITTKLLANLRNGYDVNVLPYGTSIVNVTLDYVKLISLNANEQTLDMIVELVVKWNDYALIWDPADYGNYTQFTVPRTIFWSPDITVLNAQQLKATSVFNDERLRLYSNGMVQIYLPLLTTFICPLDMKAFPFDKQHCEICFLSHSYDEEELTFQPIVFSDYGDVGNGEWSVDNFTAYSKITVSPTGFTRRDVFVTFTLTRTPVFYIAVIVVPTFLLANVCILGLFGPKPESDIGPEKVPLSLATLMAMTVLLSIVADYLPRNQIPLIGYYILAEIVLCVLAAFLSVAISFVRSTKALGRNVKENKKTAENRQAKFQEKPPSYSKYWTNSTSSDIVSHFVHFYRRIDGLITKSEHEIDRRSERETQSAMWSRLAVKINMTLVVAFLTANVGLLIALMCQWR